MADRFWVGGSGNWSDATNHWATTTGGAPGAGNLPTASDNAIFDTASNAVGYTVTIDSAAVCLDLTFGAPLTGTITWAGSATMAISSSMTLLNGMTRTYTGAITFNATSTGKTITSNGVTLASQITLNGAGGGWTLQDNFQTSGNYINFAAGTFNTNTKSITNDSGFVASGATARTLIISGSTITLGTVGSIGWQVSSSVSLTVDTTTLITGIHRFDGGGLTYNDVTFNTATSALTLNNANIFRNLTTIPGQATTLTVSANQTITGTLTQTGNSVSSRLLIVSSVVGTARTITAAAASLTDVDFTDITGAGAASPFTGTRLGDCKGNSGITFTAAANKYYVGNTANWNSANVWALTSGGAGATNNFPLPQDTAVLDAGSFSANGQTLTVSAAHRIGSLLCSGTDQTYNFSLVASLVFYGDVTFDSNLTNTSSGTFTFSGRNTQTITTAGKSLAGSLTINSIGGTVSLADALTGSAIAATFSLTLGTLDLNGKTLSYGNFESSNSNARTIKSSVNGGKIITTNTAAATVFVATTTTNLTIDRATGTWTIEIGGNTANLRQMAVGAGKSWPAISFTNTTAGGEFRLSSSGAATVIKSLSVTNPAQTIKRTAGTTITIEDNNGFPSGTVGNLVTIGSITAASHTWAKSGGGQISADYLSISYSTATPSSTWYAGANSTNGGNNSGWNFTIPPPFNPGFMLWFAQRGKSV